MVDLNENAQRILLKLIVQYSDFHRRGEYGSSSFWNWYYQVRNYIYQLDKQNYPIGNGLKCTMKTWGDIEFSRLIIGREIFVVVTDFAFNEKNFNNWIRYNRLPSKKPKQSPTQSIVSWDFDNSFKSYKGTYVVVSNNGLYSLADKNCNLKINMWFETITFPLIKTVEGVDTIGQGTASHFNYLITPNLKILHPAEVAIRNRRKFEGKLERVIIETINTYLRKNLLLAN